MSKQLSQLSLNSQNLRKTSAAHIARARKMRADLGRVKERSAILIANSRAIVGRFLSSKDAERGAALGCEDSPSRDLLSVVEQLKTRRSATVAGGAAPTIYVGFFWDERHQSVTFHFTSGDLIEAIILAYDHLRNARVHDPYFREFLLDRLQSWDGEGAHMTTLDDGKLTLFSTRFGSVAAELPAAREDWFSSRIEHTQHFSKGRSSRPPA